MDRTGKNKVMDISRLNKSVMDKTKFNRNVARRSTWMAQISAKAGSWFGSPPSQPVHNFLINVANKQTNAGTRVIIKVSGHQHQWLALGYDLEIGYF